MAEKRMFAKSIVLSDSFLDMPASARCLYFTLNMLADDDGFVSSPKSIMRQCMASADDMRVLLSKSYLIPFDSGVVVIRHWRINNYLRCDRYKPTVFVEEKSMLCTDDSGAYQLAVRDEIPSADREIPEPELLSAPCDVMHNEVTSRSKDKSCPPKIPLTEREPKNDIEVVEKEYLSNYKTLYEQGILKSEAPVINWSASRKLTKDCISHYGLGNVVGAVKRSISNDFCVRKGYSLTTILSGGVLAELINGTRDPPLKKRTDSKYDIGSLVGG